jgi:hypothetical protein
VRGNKFEPHTDAAHLDCGTCHRINHFTGATVGGGIGVSNICR